VPDLIADTAVEPTGAPGRYAATLSPDWAVWGPNGGYIAAIALRAALASSRFKRPASFHCHFLAVGRFEPVEISVTAQGGGKRAESLRVELSQQGRLLLAASVWTVDEPLEGFEHDFGRPPEVKPVGDLQSFAQLAGDEYAQWYPIWRSIEARPQKWREPPGDPVWRCWLRFVETPIIDVETDAVRQLFWLDLPGWNAAISAHSWPFRYLAPNLDLTVQFHRFAPGESWMLADGTVPLATDGLVASVSRLWTEDGRLLATGTSKHTCRPNPVYEQDLARAREMGLVRD